MQKRSRPFHYAKKTGAAPGALIHTGRRYLEQPIIDQFSYDDETFEESKQIELEEVIRNLESERTGWVNITGLHDPQLISAIGKTARIHPLVQEDIMNTSGRPKAEFIAGQLHIVLRMLDMDPEGRINSEQVTLVVTNHQVLSFQERVGDVFEPVRQRIRTRSGIIRDKGSDYLAYALIDAVADRYFIVLEQLYDQIEELEERVNTQFEDKLLLSIQTLRKELITLRRALWPLREAISSLLRDQNPLIEQSSIPYYRDLYDHIIQMMDLTDSYRDLLTGVMEAYTSNVSNRMNSIMKVLTLISTFFIPLTFIAGIYGMNFQNMPELQLAWGYPAIWALMIVISIGMVIFFKRKRWF